MTRQDIKLSQMRGKKEKWTIYKKFPKDYLKGSDFSDLEKQLLYTRGIKDKKEAEKFLNPNYDDLHDPYLMKGMKEAVERIKAALKDKEKVMIYGDYDVDGITATAILHIVLSELGLITEYYIPKRDTEGYGVSKEALDEIAKKGAKLIITVDCGITAVDEVEHAKGLGLDIIVTDHHAIKKGQDSRLRGNDKKGSGNDKKGSGNLKEVLPDTTVINPKQKVCKYPYKELSGSGIAFKLAQALYKKFPDKLLNGQEKWLLDLVALGTVCDVVPLMGENRILTYFGLKVIQQTKRVGLKALAEVSRTGICDINTYKIGFQLGPRLNAAGRLETAEKSIQLLLSKDESGAKTLAGDLDGLNRERQELTQKIVEEAIVEVEKKDKKVKLYLLKDKNWPSGVVGIVASKLSEKYYKPVIVCEDKGKECQGSARSPKCFSVIDALEEVSEYLVRYGGHPRAAGITVKKEHFILLENKLLEIADGVIKEEDLVGEYKIDSEICLDDINSKTFGFLCQLEPFGIGNPMPIFVSKDIKVEDSRKVGKAFEHLKLLFTDGKVKVNGIYFSFTGDGVDHAKTVDVVFNMSENEWMGRKSYEMRVKALKEQA